MLVDDYEGVAQQKANKRQEIPMRFNMVLPIVLVATFQVALSNLVEAQPTPLSHRQIFERATQPKYSEFMGRAFHTITTQSDAAVRGVVASTEPTLVREAVLNYLELVKSMANRLILHEFPWNPGQALTFDDLGILVSVIAHWYATDSDRAMFNVLGQKTTEVVNIAIKRGDEAIERGHYNVCVDTYEGVSKLSARFQNKEVEAFAYSRLAYCFEVGGNRDKALYYRDKAKALN